METVSLSVTGGDQAEPGGTGSAHDEQARVAEKCPDSEFCGFDTTRPNIARVYDYWLGGKENFAVDRDLAQRTMATCPELPQWARDNRAFVCAAAERAAQAGITQFIDLGCGLPTHPAVHEAARSVIGTANVAYVDNDALVILHANALLRDVGLTAVQADLTDPDAVLADPGVRDVIDVSRPVCAIFGGVLHFHAAESARKICAAWADRLVSGSWLAVTVGHYQDPAMVARLLTMYTAAPFHNHTSEDLASFLAGLDMLSPGVAEAKRWRAGVAARFPERGLYALCAAAVKPYALPLRS